MSEEIKKIEAEEEFVPTTSVDEENHDVRKVISREEGDTEAGEPPFKSITEEVTPNK